MRQHKRNGVKLNTREVLINKPVLIYQIEQREHEKNRAIERKEGEGKESERSERMGQMGMSYSPISIYTSTQRQAHGGRGRHIQTDREPLTERVTER